MSQIFVCVCFTSGISKEKRLPLSLSFGKQTTKHILYVRAPHLEKCVQNGATNSIYHLWYIYLHLVDFYGKLVDKTTIAWMLWEYLHLSLNDSPHVLASPGAHDFPVHMMAGLQASGISEKKTVGHLLDVQPWTLSTGGCFFFKYILRWWQLKYFLCSPRKLGKISIYVL